MEENAILKNELTTTALDMGEVRKIGEVDSTPDFNDLFDLRKIQQIQDAFDYAVGKPITKPSNFCQLCKIIRSTKIGLENCMNSDAALGCFNPTGPNISPCLSGGLWDAGVSLVAGDKHVANWLVGQVIAEEEQVESVLRYTQEIGADSEQVRIALEAVTRMPLERLRNICQFFFLIANQLSKLATENIQKENEIGRRLSVERLQAALYQISETASSSHSLKELYQSVHIIIGTLIPAKNFYIAIKDDENNMLHFPYRVDECDGNSGSRKLTNGLAEYLIRIGQPMLVDPKLRDELEQRGDAITIGKRAMDWLGVPLKTADTKTFGVMAVFTFA